MKAKQLTLIANDIRRDIISMVREAGSGHVAGPLGVADILTVLYYEVLNIKPHEPDWPERDRFVLSAGHLCPALYSVLAHRGYFERQELSTYRQLGSRLQGHPHFGELPGIETTSGPLGQGLSQAVGMALAAKISNKRHRIYVLLSDGEHNEGQVWEAIMLAAKYGLNNLTAVVDRNNIQISGFTEEIMPLEPLAQKYQAFNWHVLDVDGHNFEDLIGAFRHARATFEKPTVVVAHTIPGKGVEFMEHDWRWHGKVPDRDQASRALKELRSLHGSIQTDYD